MQLAQNPPRPLQTEGTAFVPPCTQALTLLYPLFSFCGRRAMTNYLDSLPGEDGATLWQIGRDLIQSMVALSVETVFWSASPRPHYGFCALTVTL